MQYYSITEAAQLTGADPATIRGMARDGLIAAFEEGGRWALPEESIDRLTQLAEEAEAAIEEGADELDEASDEDEDEDEDEDDDVYDNGPEENPDANPDDEDD